MTNFIVAVCDWWHGVLENVRNLKTGADFMREEKPLKAIASHIDATYWDYYGGPGGQPIDWVEAEGMLENFCRCNINKYNVRIDKKNDFAEDQLKDSLKLAHYAVLLVGCYLQKIELEADVEREI